MINLVDRILRRSTTAAGNAELNENPPPGAAPGPRRRIARQIQAIADRVIHPRRNANANAPVATQRVNHGGGPVNPNPAYNIRLDPLGLDELSFDHIYATVQENRQRNVAAGFAAMAARSGNLKAPDHKGEFKPAPGNVRRLSLSQLKADLDRKEQAAITARFRHHLTLPADQREILAPLSNEPGLAVLAFAELSIKEQAGIYPYLDPQWRAQIATPDQEVDIYPDIDPAWRAENLNPDTRPHLRRVYVDPYQIPGKDFRSEHIPDLHENFMNYVMTLDEADAATRDFMLRRLAFTATFKDIMPQADYLALRIYMGGPGAFAYKGKALFAAMNEAMRTLGMPEAPPKDRLDAWRTLQDLDPFVKVFTSACNRAPRYSGIAYRGIRLSKAAALKEFVPQQQTIRHAFTSTSKTVEGAMSASSGRNLQFIMHVDDCPDLAEANMTQQEVMVMPGTVHDVESTEIDDLVVIPTANFEMMGISVDDSDPDNDYPPIKVTMRQIPDDSGQ